MMTINEVIRLIRPNILALEPYSTARDEFKGGEISVWVDANENPYDNGINRYPDPHQHALKAKIADIKGVSSDKIFIGGSGSDEAIDLVYRIFCVPGKDNAIAIAPSYGVYAVSAEINDIFLQSVMLNPDYSLPVEKMLDAANEYTKVLWICSPNNPTGNAFPHKEILKIVEKFRGVVVVDEAYIDFSAEGSLLKYLNTHPNLIILQTFSKAWGMAGMRSGIAIAHPEIIRYFDRVKYPYNMNGPTQESLMKYLNKDILPQVAEILEQRDILTTEIAKFPYVETVYPSDANFILIKVDDPDKLYDYLIRFGVIVRNRNRVKGCEGCLRITVGTPAENKMIIKLLKEYNP